MEQDTQIRNCPEGYRAVALKTNCLVQAWELGAGTDMEREMTASGKIIAHPDGSYELFSREASEGKGQMARAGDFFKVNAGYPHPNERAFFLQNHRPLGDDRYLQKAEPLKIWRLGEPETEEIRFLVDEGRLQVHPGDPERYFTAELWGTEETAPSDAAILFYSVDRDPEERITGIEFNFVVKEYLDANYTVIRTMTIEDYDRVYALWMSCKNMGFNNVDDSREGIGKYLKRNPSTCFAAEQGGRIVGVVLTGHDGRRGFIHHMAVAEDCRRQGIAQAMLEQALGALKEEGISKVALVVFNRNEAGNAFWERQGFTVREDLTYRNRALRELIRMDT